MEPCFTDERRADDFGVRQVIEVTARGERRCQGSTAETLLCNGCLNFSPVCFQSYNDAMCFLEPCHACELSGPFRHDVGVKIHSHAQLREAAPSSGELK